MKGTLTIRAHGDREIVMTRWFDAPRPLVFEALTRPELLQRWMGPRGWTLPVCEMDLTAGGAYRFVGRKDTGVEMGWGGVIREIVPPERIVQTERFDDPWYPGESVVTSTLVEQDSGTLLTVTMLFDSRESRDTALQSPMESGVAESYDRLAEVLTSASTR